MTDAERNQKFDEIKRRTAITLLGIDPESPECKAKANVALKSEVTVIDENWSKSNPVSWMDKVRITDPMNVNTDEDMNAYIAKKNASRREADPYRGWKLAGSES